MAGSNLFVLEHTLDYVIRRLRKDFSARTSRLRFITKMDLWNIIQKYGLRPGFRDSNDLKSVQMREHEHNLDDGIRFFQMPVHRKGKGFILIIITPTQVEWLRKYSSRGISLDDTHGATRYNLKLATVVVADEKDRGLPAAFLLSGSMTTADVEKLFREIKNLVPEFDPRQVVTDEAICFYNAFRAVFPSSRAKLHYCRWHISHTWDRKLKKLVEPRFRESLKKDLNELLRIGQLEEFQSKFPYILAFLDVQKQDKMAHYLRSNYLGRTSTWASFAVQGAVMETTMLSERWHSRLKNEILHRNANSRVDCLVELLIRAVEDLAESNEVNDRRRLARSSYRVQQTVIRLRSAITYLGKNPEGVQRVDTKKWEVAGKSPEETFTVVDKGGCNCALPPSSNVHCPRCQVCPYSWTCTCLDNRAGISCMHRHAVAIREGGVTPSTRNRHEEVSSLSTIVEDRSEDFEVVVPAQERLEERKAIRSKIEMAYYADKGECAGKSGHR